MMNRSELKRIHRKLKEVVEELESAIYSDKERYTNTLPVDYQDVLDYYNDTANAEEGL
tara:strand:- start:106 stop:279 length:174 start_codon:yes stop_codon:yes gene_type:complete